MVDSADDFVAWKDFPKGLKVLLLYEDEPSAIETKSKLEEMDYIVSLYHNEEDALEAISKKAESFHVAIVEVATNSRSGSFKFLEMAQDLPTIVISDVHNLSTMMKCIALGAAEFLRKPLSEDKLRNIWQHVVHKAFNAGSSVLSKSLVPVKETVVSMLRNQSEPAELKNEATEAENDDTYGCVKTMANDRFSAPSTPQLEQGGRFPRDGEFQEVTNCSIAKDLIKKKHSSSSMSKSVENTCDNSISIAKIKEDLPSKLAEDIAAEEEVDSVDGSKTDECSAVKEGSLRSSHLHNNVDNIESDADDPEKKKLIPSQHGSRSNRKKLKVDWTPELHRRFVQAVEQLGIDQAIPSKILEVMKVEGLTRHNIASHLQKYRMHRRHILPKDEDKHRRWQAQREPSQKYYMPKPPVMAYPPFHPSCGASTSQQNIINYPVWGHPSYHSHGVQFWGHAAYTAWHPPPQSWPWKTYPVVHAADAWGCPVVTQYPPQYPMSSSSPRTVVMSSDPGTSGVRNKLMLKDSYGDLHQVQEEVIDEVVKEAMSKPWLPLPLGLKPPSTDAVLAELHRQGIICTIPRPPATHHSTAAAAHHPASCSS